MHIFLQDYWRIPFRKCAPALSEKKSSKKKFRLRRQKKKRSKHFSPAAPTKKSQKKFRLRWWETKKPVDWTRTWKGLGHGQEGGGGKLRNLWTGRGLGRDLEWTWTWTGGWWWETKKPMSAGIISLKLCFEKTQCEKFIFKCEKCVMAVGEGSPMSKRCVRGGGGLPLLQQCVLFHIRYVRGRGVT